MKDLTIAMFYTPDRVDMLDLTLESINRAGEISVDEVVVEKFRRGQYPRGEMLNRTVAATDSRWVCLTVPDTIWTPGVLEEVQTRAKTTEASVMGAIRLEKWPGGVQLYFPSLQIPVLNLLMFRREDFDRVGGFNPWFDGWGLYEGDLCDRMWKAGIAREKFEIIRECYWHEPHSSNESMEGQERNKQIKLTSVFDGKEWHRA